METEFKTNLTKREKRMLGETEIRFMERMAKRFSDPKFRKMLSAHEHEITSIAA